MEFLGVPKKQNAEFPKVSLKRCGNSRGDKKNIGISSGLGFWFWNFQGVQLTQLYITEIGLFQKKSKHGGLRIYFFKNSHGIFHFFTLPLKIPDKTKLNPWIFHKILLDPLKISRPKSKTPGNSTLIFLGHPWKFHFVFS